MYTYVVDSKRIMYAGMHTCLHAHIHTHTTTNTHTHTHTYKPENLHSDLLPVRFTSGCRGADARAACDLFVLFRVSACSTRKEDPGRLYDTMKIRCLPLVLPLE